MSGQHVWPGHPPRRTTHPAIAAAAAIIVLALGACTSTTSTSSTPASVVAAASTAPGGHKPTLQPGADSYPISGYSWALVYTHQPGQARGQALVTMLDWLTHDGQASAAANGYVPLLVQVQQLARPPSSRSPAYGNTPAELTRTGQR